MSNLKTSWLIQRLLKPRPSSIANVFSFGGGLKNGGLSDDAMSMLNPIFSFDYMGSSEFEFGAIPEFFQEIAKNQKNYVSSSIVINNTPVFIICDKNVLTDVSTRIVVLAVRYAGLKGHSGFPTAVGNNTDTKKEDCRYIGWLELDNNFMFFTDKTAFLKTASLFGIEVHKNLKNETVKN